MCWVGHCIHSHIVATFHSDPLIPYRMGEGGREGDSQREGVRGRGEREGESERERRRESERG